MRMILAVVLCFAGMTGAVVAQQGPFARAMEAVRGDDYQTALQSARRSETGQIAVDVVLWHQLRAGVGALPEYQNFLDRRPDWPGLPLLQRRGEAAITSHTPNAQVLNYFSNGAPQTGDGALALARALRANGRRSDADEVLRTAWISHNMGVTTQAAYLDQHAALIRSLNETRMDMLLWRGRSREATALLPYVSAGWQALAQARMGLRAERNGVNALIDAVPASLRNDPGLAFERFRWRADNGEERRAAELAIERGRSTASLGQPESWANWRRILTRRFMREGQNRLAYQLASSNQLSEGSNFADLEWLSGYIALTKLNDPQTAIRHFRRFRAAVWTPISLGRAGYWEGRALEAAGDRDGARVAYAFGAEYQSSFYGQLAAERAGLPFDQALTGRESYGDFSGASFMRSSVMQAALLLQAAGEETLSERFMVHLGESLSRTELGQMADLALSLNEYHISLMIAKQAARQGHTLPRAYFPLHPVGEANLPAPPELALSIARRESEFDQVVISPAGARGLMQLMPGTAQDVSGDLGIGYSGSRLLSDWRYNARLGSSYLDGLIDQFGDNYILVSAGYNAGPRRPRQWIERFGDPRRRDLEGVIDWIEHIPFRETRNYVMRVTESVTIYQARLTGRTQGIRLSDVLR
ncbi:lytic transglycosylase domain-containing protein [Cochlodiniinecator piscidefendens]|uniref:lytic transglycosylase domain-containing protein n=1 Tax=Cochlodiniinecator piscidefendens TaxID=2715756 RepID=UPI0014088A27|nr:lytic transglycosylase domain-containing protein [Cochlodiniinecator piscidefendens]